MSAFENIDSSTNQCSLLNRAGNLSNLWFNVPSAISVSSPSALANMFASGNGTLTTFSQAIAGLATTDLQNTILTSSEIKPQSTATLQQFLSGGGVANSNVNHSILSNVLLGGAGQGASASSGNSSIVDNFFISSVGSAAAYTFSTPEAPLLSGSAFGDIVNKLIAKKLLISQDDLFNPSDFSGSPVAGSESLMYLMSLDVSTDKRGSPQITNTQQARIYTLQATNLRFLGAWLAEYCFYRSRYQYLLSLYFSVYTEAPYSAPNLTTSSVAKLFTGKAASNPAPNQYTNTTLLQTEYLRCLIFHMACLNTRMVDMRTLLGAISTYYSSAQTAIQTIINSGDLPGSDAELVKKISLLNESATQVQSYLTDVDFKKSVAEYNLEKNRYSNILLSFYAFLNIVAVAVIIQVSKN